MKDNGIEDLFSVVQNIHKKLKTNSPSYRKLFVPFKKDYLPNRFWFEFPSVVEGFLC